MWSWLTGDSGLSFTANSDSPSTPGEKSVLSDAIEGVDADKLIDAFDKYIKAGKTADKNAAEVKVSEKDGGTLVAQTFEIPAILGGGTHTFYLLHKVDVSKRMIEIQNFPSQFVFDNNQPLATSYIHILSDPVKIEWWTQAHEARSSGKVLKGMMDKVLSELDPPVESKCDQPGITDPSAHSVVSAPISDPKVSPESYLDFFKEILVDKMGATECPDGTIVEERSNVLAEFGVGNRSFARHKFNKEENHLYCEEYGADESMSELVGITHVQVHKEPFRLEQWNTQKAMRRAGEGSIKWIEPFAKGVLESLKEG